ncbi:cobalt-precorrin-6A reductase [Sphingobium sp. YR768]|uniref:cobalt-precorrin-6A reductase n=1 Tax=Sphingobium sp. YR768 TaxID=1884365 RepID=UPI0008CCB574|nr:cobalt-precorrin-6A reductase [Sphingobium sp. YR768]SEQ73004.1 precorrin-6A/cobalt-precorrin-6A reductase [Sphingobium sp. YR768]
MRNILILGGTTEASALARLLAERGERPTLSYAGRVDNPRPQPVPVRVGGFGGTEGLAAYLRQQGVTHLVDATHPFAAMMSGNAVMAARQTGVPLIALTRPAWPAESGDRWTHVPDITSAIAALDGPARRIMLALGRMHADAFAAQPQHFYLLRFVDAPTVPPALPNHHLLVDRGPFDADGDMRLMQDHGIDLILCKNAGGTGAQAKLIAARRLGLPVLMIDRPALPDRLEVHDPHIVLHWLDHATDRGV